MPLAEEVIEDLKVTFSLVDKNGDGEITAEEFGAYCQTSGKCRTEAELKAIVNSGDIDGNGSLNWEEYLAVNERVIMQRMRQPQTEKDVEDELHVLFRIFDKDRDGFITREELQEGMSYLEKYLTEEGVNEWIREADTDGDEKISWEEFMCLMKPKEPAHGEEPAHGKKPSHGVCIKLGLALGALLFAVAMYSW